MKIFIPLLLSILVVGTKADLRGKPEDHPGQGGGKPDKNNEVLAEVDLGDGAKMTFVALGDLDILIAVEAPGGLEEVTSGLLELEEGEDSIDPEKVYKKASKGQDVPAGFQKAWNKVKGKQEEWQNKFMA